MFAFERKHLLEQIDSAGKSVLFFSGLPCVGTARCHCTGEISYGTECIIKCIWILQMLLKHKCTYKTALRIFLFSHQPWITELWSQATLHYQLHYDSQILFILTILHGSIIIPSHVWFIKVFCSEDKCYNMPYCNHANCLSSFPYLNYAFAELFCCSSSSHVPS